MKKPYVVKKIDFGDSTSPKKKLTRDEFINLSPKRDRELHGKIYDLMEIIRASKLFTREEKKEALNKIRELKNEINKPLPPYDWGNYDIDFNSNEIKYDSDGMRDDDEYNPKNWKGHDD